MSPPTVLPGSDAAKAVAKVGQYVADQGAGLQLPVLEQYVKDVIVEYGGDPVTAAASARTVTVMAERDPANTQGIAEHIVAKAVSDPNTISDRIRENVQRGVAERGGLNSLTKDEQKALAYDEASGALRSAGITDTQSHADLKTRINDYIDQGASPEVAAAAAAAPALAAGGPVADSLSIFGYLVMLVHGDVKYVFNNSETLNVSGSAIHSHMKSVKYDMSAYNFDIVCDTIQTSSTNEFLNGRFHIGLGVGNYPGTYKALMTSAFSFYGGVGKLGMQWRPFTLYSLNGTKKRLYLAGIDNDMVMYNRAIEEDRDHRETSVLTVEQAKQAIQRTITKWFN